MRENFSDAEKKLSEKAENMKSAMQGFSDNVREELKRLWNSRNR